MKPRIKVVLRLKAGTRRRGATVMFAVLLALGTMAGCATSTASRKAPNGFVSCETAGIAGFCASLSVPVDWANATGPTTADWVILIPAKQSPAPDPLFFIAGGPGADADQYFPWLTETFGQINETHDLVFVEQRGTNSSNNMVCPGLEEGTSSEALRNAVELCLTTYGADASHFSTPAAANDLDYVRRVLGYRKIDLYGVSYGVSLGLAYVQQYSSHVRSAVFDSGSLLSVPLWQEAPQHAQQAFDLLVRRCHATPTCAKAYNPAADLATVIAEAKKLGGPNAVAAILSDIDDDYLAESTKAAFLPADLHLAARNGIEALLRKRKSWIASTTTSSTLLMPLTVECGDAWAAINPKAIDTSSTFAPMEFDKAAYENTLCPIWPHDPGASGVVRTAAPILFLNGTADPTDPPVNVAAATTTMPNAVIVSIPGSAHWVLSASWNWGSSVPPCLVSNVSSFVESGSRANQRAWAACMATLASYVPTLAVP